MCVDTYENMTRCVVTTAYKLQENKKRNIMKKNKRPMRFSCLLDPSTLKKEYNPVHGKEYPYEASKTLFLIESTGPM